MGSSRALSPTMRGVSLIAVFFLVLVFLPKFLIKTKLSFDPESSVALPNPRGSFPLEAQLQVIRDTSAAHRPPGKKVLLSELFQDGTPSLLLNFWATWCPPCLEELPNVELLNRELKKRSKSNLPLLVTISVDDQSTDVARLEKTLDFIPSYIVLYDRDGELARSVGTTKFPESYLVSKNGTVLYKWLGPQSWLSIDVLRKLIPN